MIADCRPETTENPDCQGLGNFGAIYWHRNSYRYWCSVFFLMH